MESKLNDFFKNHNIPVSSQNSRSFIFTCPACGGEKKLYVEKKDGKSVCFKGKTDKCPTKGSSAAYALSLLSGLPIHTVKREIYDFVAHLVDEIRVSFEDEKTVEEPLKTVPLPGDIVFMGEPAAADGLNYLIGRGIPEDIQTQNNILYSPSMRRVIFPVIMDNKLYGWQGRAIDKVDHQYRMYNVPGRWRARTLMFYENLAGKDFAIIAEGPISALKFAQVGGFVATMGKEVSRQQLDLLRKAGIKRIYLALDRDAIDKMEPIRYHVASDLNGKMQCFFIPIPDHRDDFGDCTFEECAEAFKKAEELVGDDIHVHIEPKLSYYGKK